MTKERVVLGRVAQLWGEGRRLPGYYPTSVGQEIPDSPVKVHSPEKG